MNILNLISIKSQSAVDGGKSLDNFFKTKKPKKGKAHTYKGGKYGVGIITGSPTGEAPSDGDGGGAD